MPNPTIYDLGLAKGQATRQGVAVVELHHLVSPCPPGLSKALMEVRKGVYWTAFAISKECPDWNTLQDEIEEWLKNTQDTIGASHISRLVANMGTTSEREEDIQSRLYDLLITRGSGQDSTNRMSTVA